MNEIINEPALFLQIKNSMKKNVFLVFYLIQFSVLSQNLILDSLYQNLQKEGLNDTTKILLFNEIAFEIRYSFPDSSIKMVEKMLLASQKIDFIKGNAGAEYILGIHKSIKSDYAEATRLFFKCLSTFEKLKDERQVARVLNNISIVYYYQSKYEKAEEFLKKALKISEKIKNYTEVARCYNNLGRIYFEQNKYNVALNYAQKVLDIINKNNIKGDISIYYCNLSEYSMKLNKSEQALDFAEKALISARITQNKRMIIRPNIIKASIFIQKNEIQKADTLLKEAGELLKNAKYPEEELLYFEYAYQFNQKQRNYEKSLLFFQKYVSLKDSVQSVRNYKATIQKDYEYNEKLKEEHRQVEREKEFFMRVFLFLGVVILLAVLFFVFRAFQIKSKILKTISEQKEVIELKTEQITSQKSILEQTYEQLKNTSEILDKSLAYASKIQNLVLPTTKDLKEFFNDFFVVFQPKDVVSGDFYSFTRIDNQKAIFVMADCTGHGVSGAFMTMLGNALLHEIIKERMIYSPNLIIKELHDSIYKILKQYEGDNTDGMDICICLFDKNEKENQLNITFAGSKSSMYYIDNQKLVKISGDKIRIGGSNYNQFEFNNKDFSLPLNNARFYFVTDGFYDQNNKERKKFGSAKLQHILLENAHLPLFTQKENILVALQNHQQDEEQRDDISLVGLRF